MKDKRPKKRRVSDFICKEIIQLFAADLTAMDIARVVKVSRVTINTYLKLIRIHIARHCEERKKNIGYHCLQLTALHTTITVTELEKMKNAYFGLAVINDNIFTEALLQLNKATIRAHQQARRLQPPQILVDATHDLSLYTAIGDFNGRRLYRIDANEKTVSNPTAAIGAFWEYCQHRLLKFRGIDNKVLYLHVKECEFRYNYRHEDINRILLNIINENLLQADRHA